MGGVSALILLLLCLVLIILFFRKRNKTILKHNPYTTCEVINAKDMNFDDAVPQPKDAAYNDYASLSEVMSEANFNGLSSQNSLRSSKKKYKKFTQQEEDY